MINWDLDLKFAWQAHAHAHAAREDAVRMWVVKPATKEKLMPLVLRMYSKLDNLGLAINQNQGVHMVMYAQEVNSAHDRLRDEIESLQNEPAEPRTPRGQLIPPGSIIS